MTGHERGAPMMVPQKPPLPPREDTGDRNPEGKQETKHVSAEVLESGLIPACAREKPRCGRPHARLQPAR